MLSGRICLVSVQMENLILFFTSKNIVIICLKLVAVKKSFRCTQVRYNYGLQIAMSALTPVLHLSPTGPGSMDPCLIPLHPIG